MKYLSKWHRVGLSLFNYLYMLRMRIWWFSRLSEREVLRRTRTNTALWKCVPLTSVGDPGDAFLTAACIICVWQSHRLCFHTRRAYVLCWRDVCCSTWHNVSLLCVQTTSVCSGAQSSLLYRYSSSGVIQNLTFKNVCIFRRGVFMCFTPRSE